MTRKAVFLVILGICIFSALLLLASCSGKNQAAQGPESPKPPPVPHTLDATLQAAYSAEVDVYMTPDGDLYLWGSGGMWRIHGDEAVKVKEVKAFPKPLQPATQSQREQNLSYRIQKLTYYVGRQDQKLYDAENPNEE